MFKSESIRVFEKKRVLFIVKLGIGLGLVLIIIVICVILKGFVSSGVFFEVKSLVKVLFLVGFIVNVFGNRFVIFVNVFG